MGSDSTETYTPLLLGGAKVGGGGREEDEDADKGAGGAGLPAIIIRIVELFAITALLDWKGRHQGEGVDEGAGGA